METNKGGNMKLEATITQKQLARLQEKLAEVNKKAEKLGVDSFTLTTIENPYMLHVVYWDEYHHCRSWGNVDSRTRNDSFRKILSETPMVDVEVEGSVVKVGNYEAIARLERVGEGTVIFRFSDFDVPINFESNDYHCDHCESVRRRKSVYIFKSLDDNSLVQIGSSCVKDFTGHTITAMSWYEDTLKSLGEYEDPSEESANSNFLYSTQYLAYVIHFIETCGYTANKTATEEHPSTSTLATLAYWNKENTDQPGETCWKLAEEVLAWMRENGETLRIRNEFWHNLIALAQDDMVHSRFAGFLAYFPMAYSKETEVKIEKEKVEKVSHHIGVVGEMLETTVSVSKVKFFESAYGSMALILLMDSDGSVFVWKTSSYPAFLSLDSFAGVSLRIKGRIKKHSNFLGVDQTELLRVKVLDTVYKVS
jgi:hypothetical protein